eukprot:TRINITY_DN60035_c0_g1_i1.p1 TRINITY_DN60035_c0_g1~~TRINITY_DN60035_c0_g1_i1.p1  ORF type:complete len:919 (-),score=186.16 TRINITY_DN60035_c0_g1_i1:78-2771(-)
MGEPPRLTPRGGGGYQPLTNGGDMRELSLAPYSGHANSSAYLPGGPARPQAAAARMVVSEAQGQGRQKNLPPMRGDGDDIIQFCSTQSYVEQDQGEMKVYVMRLGSLSGEVSVEYYTKEASAVAGQAYIHQEGSLVFADGVDKMTIKVPILQHDLWDSTLQFKVFLVNPRDCKLGQSLDVCNLKVIDDTQFPSDKYETEVQQGLAVIKLIPPWSLFWEFANLVYQACGIRKNTLIVLVMDNMKNMYLVITIWANMYLVNVVCHDNEETDQKLLIPGGRLQTAYLVGALYALPMIALHIWDSIKQQMDIDGIIAAYLRVRLFRHYLNYTDDARGEVNSAMMQMCVNSDTEMCSKAYIALLTLVTVFGKLAIQIGFILFKNPGSAWVVIAMPLCMGIWGGWAEMHFLTIKGSAKARSAMLEFLGESVEDIETIIDYKRRPLISEIFEEKANGLRKAIMPSEKFRLHEKYILEWFGPLFISFYIAIEIPAVLDKSVTLGAFLATISIIKGLSDNITNGFGAYQDVTGSYKSLQRVTHFLNGETACLSEKVVQDERLEEAHNLLEEMKKGNLKLPDDMPSHLTTRYMADLMPIRMEGVYFENHIQQTVLEDVNISVPQGVLIGVVGEPGTCRASLLRLIASKVEPTDGRVFVPAHLRTVHVSMDPCMLTLSAFHDLTFGIVDKKQLDNKRVAWILDKLDMSTMLELVKDDLTHDHKKEKIGDHDTDTDWQKRLTGTEQSMLHLTRALVMNPEVLVLQRPMHRFNGHRRQNVRDMLVSHVQQRGLCLPAAERHLRRPRTVVYSADEPEELEGADYVWKLVRKNPTCKFPCSVIDVTKETFPNRCKSRAVPQYGNKRAFPENLTAGDAVKVNAGLKGALQTKAAHHDHHESHERMRMVMSSTD